ncbi:MAG: adenylate kinase [Candidatus Saganbacteria bacterium]|uniref:Adenylate kinase n=1 Tax=Candidatus Saganbacteria bacterium TaxID=2575572 RepID=A0A833NS21_UNCSA|nr:MAG: adenylate kinase [Candidatus Saganbacteria bacterium]
MILIFLGPPGSGKGTQAKRIADQLNLPHIALGDILREEIREETEYGKKAKAFVEAGKLVPDEVTIEITKNRLLKSDCKNGLVLDGFPRSIMQADSLKEYLSGKDYKVIYFKVPLERIIERNAGRLSCSSCGSVFHEKFNPPKKDKICDRCGSELYKRKDDNEEVIRHRFKVYEESTSPVVAYYEKSGNLISINAAGSIDEVFESLIKSLGI